MALTQKINGVRKMIPTPHHKTAYKTKGSKQSWYDRHIKLFTELAEEIGFEVLYDGYIRWEKAMLILRKSGFGDFTLTLTWAKNGMSTVHLYGNCTDETVYPYATWRGHDKPESHNDAHLGNWFLKLVRLDWIADNRPNKSQIKIGDEIVFSGTPAGGGQRTRAKVAGFGGAWGRNYYKVELLEDRGVKKIKRVGTMVEVHYDCIIHHTSKS
mgnify:CR=1 FL=1|tara:strand:- start:39 stop:674 length:636 start_codon:yes stop_codon:yes gene_type:complete